MSAINAKPTNRTLPAFDYFVLAAFVCVFPLDAAWYVVSIATSLPKAPLGLLTQVAVILVVFPAMLMRSARFRLFVVVLALFMVLGAYAAATSVYFDWQWAILFTWYLSMFTLGFALARSPILNFRQGRWAVTGSTLFCAVAIMALLRHAPGATGNDLNYLRPALALTFGGVISLYFLKNRSIQLVVYSAVLGALTLLTSRTFLYLWLMLPFVAITVHMVRGGLGRRRIPAIVWVVAPVLFAVGVAAAVLIVLPLLGAITNDRITPSEIVATSGSGSSASLAVQDNSLNERLMFLRLGWNQILENPIFGFYNGYLSYAEEGSYIHNVLSYWHQFGILPFVILLSMLVYCAKLSVLSPKSTAGQAAKVLFIYGCAGILFARSYVATDIFFVMGFTIAAPSQVIVQKPKRRRRQSIGKGESHDGA